MSQVDVVFALVHSKPGLTDREIGERLGMQYVAHVNQICRALAARGLIRRIPGPHGRLVSVPTSTSLKSSPGGKESGRLAPPGGTSTAAGEPAGVDAWERVAQLALKRSALAG